MNNNAKELVKKGRYYYDASKNIHLEFGGPSVYFHQEAIRLQKREFLSIRHIEMTYATLASWGMHRMGDPKDTFTKLVNFDTFIESINKNSEILQKMKNLKINELSNNEYNSVINEIKNTYLNLKVSTSNTSIVANSKLLAHLLPNLIPPIDRRYTIRFFKQDNKDFFTSSGKLKVINLPSENEKQYLEFSNICYQVKEIVDKCKRYKYDVNGIGFNTSLLKIIDNMIIVFIKKVKSDFDDIEEES